MTSIFSKFSRKKAAPAYVDNEKAGYAYEKDAGRLSKPPQRRQTATPGGPAYGVNSSPRDRYIGSFAPNPAFIRSVRFLLYGLTSLSALATAGLGIAVVQYYNSHEPAIKPSWGSLIACIVFGIGTPGALFGLFFVTPRLFRHGGVGAILNQTRIEIVLLFNLSVIWISGALALACDLRGREFCLWDGYYHYPKPSDFNDVCTLINVNVALAYTTFGLCALQMVVVTTIAMYIILYLDQEALTEPTNDLGGRAYRARVQALSQHQSLLAAQRNSNAANATSAGAGVGAGAGNARRTGSMSSSRVANAGGGGAIPSSRVLPPSIADDGEGGPMAGGRPSTSTGRQSARNSRSYSGSNNGSRPNLALGNSGDAERGHDNQLMDGEESGYYGYEGASNREGPRVV